MKILHIDSSILGDNSVSRQITAGIVARLREFRPDAQVTYRDLAAQAPAHFSAELAGVLKAGMSVELGEAQKRELALTEEMLQEFLAAHVVVVGAPMYNFSVPSQLKAWIDRLALPGRTFTYTDKGPVGLAGGKQVIVASSRGGLYADEAMKALDYQEPYLRAVFGFFGIDDITFVRAEGLAISPELRSQAEAAAQAEIARLRPTGAARPVAAAASA